MKVAFDFLKANWKGLLVGIALGFPCGWFFKPDSQPAIELEDETHAAENTKGTTDTTAHQGPKKKAGIKFDPSPGAPASVVNVPGLGPVAVPAGERLESVDLEEDAGSDSETHASAETHRSEDRKLDLTVTPFEKHYSILIGAQFLPETRPAFGGAVRLPDLPLLGTWWLQAEVAPDLKEPLKSDVRGFLRKDF